MKTNIKFYAVLFFAAISLTFSACEDEEGVAKPTIVIHELGLNDSHIGYIGSDLHVEADIVAEGKIDKIEVEIHPENGVGEEIEVEYDEFAGLKNTTFHKHIDIPATAAAGEYHFHFTVTDMEGNQTTVEDDVTIEELVDEEAPVLDITTVPTNGETFADGATITIAGTVTENNALAGMVIALVREEDNIADADVSGANSSVIVMLHTHAFDSETSHSFTASINVGAANDNNMTPAAIQGDNAWQSGNYYILVKAKDAKDNWAISSHFPIVLNL